MSRDVAGNSAKVGVVVIAAVALLAYAVRFLGGHFGVRGPTYYVELVDAGNLTAGAPVTMAGVGIGSVKSVQLANPRLARLTVEMNPGETVPVGSKAIIPTSLVGLGNQALVIVPPTNNPGPLPNHSTIHGELQSPLASAFPGADGAINQLTLTLKSAQNLLSDVQLKKSLLGTMRSTQTALSELTDMALKANNLLTSNSPTLTLAAQHAADAMGNVDKATDLMYKLLDSGKYQKQTMALLQSLQATSEKATQLVAHLDAFASDPKLKGNMEATMENAKDVSAQSKELMGSFQNIAKNGEAVSHEAIGLTKNASDVALESKGLVEKLEKLVDKVNNVVPSHKPGAGLGIGTIHTEADLFKDTGRARYRTDFNFIVPVGTEKIYGGVFDAFESNRLTLQLGRPLGNDGVFRYGVYAGKPGIGVDYALAPKISLRGDLFDLNDPSFNLSAGYDFGGGIIGFVGYNRLFDRTGISIGIGIQK